MPKYRFIEDLRKIHKGEEIWVLGCGPSLDDFPDDFFDEKKRIAITSSYSMIAFPNCTYTAFSQGDKTLMAHVLKYRKHLLYKHIVRVKPIELKNKTFFSPEPIYLRINGMELGLPDPIYLQIRGMKLEDFKMKSEELDRRKSIFSSLANDLITGKSIAYSQAGTCIHTEIQAAIIMGAKKVTLAGCEMKCLKFQAHAYKRGLDKFYKTPFFTSKIPKEGYSAALITGDGVGQKRIKAGTAFLAKIMKPHGVQIARFYYGEGYEPIA